MKIKSLAKRIIVFFYSTPLCRINKKKIVFDNFLGKGYGCNPKYIAEEIIRQRLNYDLVWLVNDLNTPMPKEIRKVKYGTMKAIKEWATAKIWIDNVRNYKGIRKKKNQFYIQTWHSGIGPKLIEGEIIDSLDVHYILESKYDGKITDLMVSDCKMMTEVYKTSFWYSGEVLEIGIPRDDILYNCPRSIINKVYNFFNIPKNKKIVLYAPTYRNNINVNSYMFDYHKCCDILEEKFGGKFVILIRLHPNISKEGEFLNYDDKIKNANDYPDIQELVAACDIGITDYSSVGFDISKAGKPVFLICKDFEEYTNTERRMRFDFNKLPMVLSKNEEELFYNIKNFNKVQYSEKCADFYKRMNLIIGNNSSNKIVNIIKEKMDN